MTTTHATETDLDRLIGQLESVEDTLNRFAGLVNLDTATIDEDDPDPEYSRDEVESAENWEYELDDYGALFDYPLEVIEETVVTRKLLISYGGPNIWIVWDDEDNPSSAYIDGYWGEHYAIRLDTDTASTLATMFFEI